MFNTIEFSDPLSTERIEWEANGQTFFAEAPDYTVYVIDGYGPPMEYNPNSALAQEDIYQQVHSEVLRRYFKKMIPPAKKPEFHQEEVVPIASYMADQMNTNRDSSYVHQIRLHNNIANRLKFLVPYVALLEKGAAYAEWAALVRPYGPWDHKPIIDQRFKRDKKATKLRLTICISHLMARSSPSATSSGPTSTTAMSAGPVVSVPASCLLAEG